MLSFFYLLFDTTQGSTVLLYSIIFVLATIFAFQCQSTSTTGELKFRPWWFFLTFLFLWFFYALNNVGIDLPHYRYYFEQYNDFGVCSRANGEVELGWQYFNVILHWFTKSEIVAVIIQRTLQLLIIFGAFFLLRDKIMIGYAVMAYTAFFYFDSYNLLRSSFAGSLILFSLSLSILGKTKWALIPAAVSFFIHQSTLLYIIAYFVYLLAFKTHFRYLKKTLPFVIVFFAVIVLSLGVNYIKEFVTTNEFGQGRYDSYFAEGSTFGVFAIFKYLPVFWVLLHRRAFVSQDEWNLSFVMSVSGFVIALMAYNIGILTRAAIYFSSPFLLTLSAFPVFCTVRGAKTKRFNYKVIIICYYVVMYIYMMGGLYNPSGIGNFEFVF